MATAEGPRDRLTFPSARFLDEFDSRNCGPDQFPGRGNTIQ